LTTYAVTERYGLVWVWGVTRGLGYRPNKGCNPQTLFIKATFRRS
jgi:hypothetical protein